MNWFDSVVGTVTDVFNTGYDALDSLAGDLLPDFDGDSSGTDGFFNTVTDAIFGEGGPFGGSSSSSKGGGSSQPAIKRARQRGIDQQGRPSREGDTAPLESADPRAIEARWLSRLDRIAQVTNKAKG